MGRSLYNYPSDRFLYNIVHRWVSIPLNLLSRAVCYDLHRMPMEGRLLVAANHTSYLDPIYLGAFLPREVNFMAKHTLFARPFGSFLRGVGAYPINREKADISALRHSLRLLKNEQAIVMFPEGTRAGEEEILEAQRGIGYLAARCETPVLPVYLNGASDVWGKGRSGIRRSHVSLHIGNPLHFDKDTDHVDAANATLEAIDGMRLAAQNGQFAGSPTPLGAPLKI